MIHKYAMNEPQKDRLYLLVTDSKFDGEKTQADLMRFGQYMNPDLALTSTYHEKLDAMMKCVAKNADIAKPGMEALQDKACAKEYKELRLQAFRGKTLYHEVMSRVFANELEFNKHMSSF